MKYLIINVLQSVRGVPCGKTERNTCRQIRGFTGVNPFCFIIASLLNN